MSESGQGAHDLNRIDPSTTEAAPPVDVERIAAAVREILLQGMALPQISTNTAYRYIYRGYLRLCSLDLPVGR